MEQPERLPAGRIGALKVVDQRLHLRALTLNQ
jgi:hypothetical protein